MLARHHPAAFSASSTRGSRTHRTALAHPPTAQATGRGLPHLLPAGCRKSPTGVHKIGHGCNKSGYLSPKTTENDKKQGEVSRNIA